MLVLLSIVVSTCLISCGGGDYYRDKNVRDAKSSFDLSTQKAECFIDALVDATDFTYETIWALVEEADEESFDVFSSSNVRLYDAMDPSFRKCGINPP